MEFRLSEDQIALRDGVRAFCDGRVPNEQFAELEKLGGFDRELWGELAEMGVFGLRLPESEGGVELGMADAVIVFSELGRRLVPGPPLDALIVLVDDRVERVDPKQVKGQAIATPLDPLTPVHHVETLPGGEVIGDASLAARIRLEGATLASGFLLGIAEASQELATAYAKEREQFGRAIGGFQAIKHILADCFVRQEVARAAAYAAGATVDHPDAGDLIAAVSGAKLNCGEAAMKNSRACIQVHGGMGYTWEVVAHYYLKRTWVLENTFGTVDEHAEIVADRVDAQVES